MPPTPAPAAAVDLTAKSVLTFDVVGTLIDFETGVLQRLQRFADEDGVAIDHDAALAAFGRASAAQHRASLARTFSDGLAEIFDVVASEVGIVATAERAADFAGSVSDWPAFPDSVEALKRLKKRYKLVALTNADDAGTAAMAKTLKKPFADVVTAEIAGASKPDFRPFAYALGRLSAKKIATEAVLHVAQSQYHDIAPARAMGLEVAWIERRQGRIGSGATPASTPVAPDLHFNRLWALADAVDRAFSDAPPEEPIWKPIVVRSKLKKAKTSKTSKPKTAAIPRAAGASAKASAASSAPPPRVAGDAPEELARLTLAEARDGLRAKAFSARELTEACLKAVDAADRLNAVVHKTPERALAMADAADRRLAAEGADAPALCGAPIGVKDLFCTEGAPSQAASRILDGFTPIYESTVTAQLWDAGAVMVGKTNMDEFAMGSSNETSCYGPAVNPWRSRGGNADLTPGGSSGGSASAVAADLCLAALGTDTGGSIRQPAAFAGIVGLKPTYGRCSRWGVVAFASSLDQAGPMTKTVRDAALMLEAISGEDPKDSTSAPRPAEAFEAALTGDLRGKRIGIPKEYRLDGMPEEIDRLWAQGAAWLKDAGAEVVDISLPHTQYALPVYYIIAPAEASSNLARYDGVRYGARADLAPGDGVTEMFEKTRAEGFGPEVKRRVLIGAYVLSAGYYDAYYLRAQKVRTLIKKDFEDAFDAGVDAILTPSTPSSAFGLGDPAMEDPVKMYLNDVFTVTVNLAGLPGISVPAGLDAEGLPLGLQLIGRPFGEAELLNAAFAVERAAGVRSRPDRWW